MRAREALLLSAVFAVAFLFLAGPAPLAAQSDPCGIVCSCATSCATSCSTFKIIDGVGQQVETDCGAFGKCTTSPSCQPCQTTCTSNVYGGSGNDTINGTAANECIWTYEGNDTVDGNAGDDKVWAGDGTDTVYGDSGNDCLYGQAGNDHLDGQSGTDYVNGGGGTDTCTGETKENCP